MLGFHYFPLDEFILIRIRNILITDPIIDIRRTAAAILGGRSQLPDEALFNALQYDSDNDVRQAAFESILRLAGMKFKFVVKESEEVTSQQNYP